LWTTPKAKLKREILTDEGDNDPMGQIESVLTEANTERAKHIENLKKRSVREQQECPSQEDMSSPSN